MTEIVMQILAELEPEDIILWATALGEIGGTVFWSLETGLVAPVLRNGGAVASFARRPPRHSAHQNRRAATKKLSV